MRKRNYWIMGVACLAAIGCKDREREYDASGMFETTEIIVSSEISGRLRYLNVEEGEFIEAGKTVGLIDTMQLHWLKMQAHQAVKAIDSRIPDVDLQLESYRRRLEQGISEEKRVARLLEGGAATQKQYDDVKTEVEVGRSMLEAQTEQLNALVASAKDEMAIYRLKIKQVEDQIERCKIVNPISGVVLAKYTEENELTAPVKALYKIGDLNEMYLRIYLGTSQMKKLRLGSPVRVFAGDAEGERKEYAGEVSWISPEAEFVPKAVQTMDERENLVYAVKIRVKNDGYLRVGMYADVKLQEEV